MNLYEHIMCHDDTHETQFCVFLAFSNRMLFSLWYVWSTCWGIFLSISIFQFFLDFSSVCLYCVSLHGMLKVFWLPHFNNINYTWNKLISSCKIATQPTSCIFSFFCCYNHRLMSFTMWEVSWPLKWPTILTSSLAWWLELRIPG